MSATLDILMITWNRPRYTTLTLQRLLDTCDQGMRVWIWQNGLDGEMLNVLAGFRGHPCLYHVHINPENKGLREPTNWFWRHAEAPYLSKVDDDCLLPDGWARTLIAAHVESPRLGLLGCWRFYDEDFVPELAERKLRELPGGHRVMLNCWVQGSGYVMKREVVQQLGSLVSYESFTDYCVRAARAGWINGWYFPFIHEEHMDDPRSPYSQLRSDEDFRLNRPLSAVNDNVQSLEEWKNRVRWMARSVQAAPIDPRYHQGWRAKLRRGVRRFKRVAGWREPWRVAV
jgi:GT2 family glycosyltransferase